MYGIHIASLFIRQIHCACCVLWSVIYILLYKYNVYAVCIHQWQCFSVHYFIFCSHKCTTINIFEPLSLLIQKTEIEVRNALAACSSTKNRTRVRIFCWTKEEEKKTQTKLNGTSLNLFICFVLQCTQILHVGFDRLRTHGIY